jgi:hypothetical protein
MPAVGPSGLADGWSSRPRQTCERRTCERPTCERAISRSCPSQPPQIATCVTSSWWIRVPWSIRGTPAPAINRQARINHANETREEHGTPETEPRLRTRHLRRARGPGPWHPGGFLGLQVDIAAARAGRAAGNRGDVGQGQPGSGTRGRGGRAGSGRQADQEIGRVGVAAALARTGRRAGWPQGTGRLAPGRGPYRHANRRRGPGRPGRSRPGPRRSGRGGRAEG